MKRDTTERQSFLRSLLHDRTANTIVISAAAMIPLMAMVGGGVDASRYYMTAARMQAACDAGALAARRAMTTDDFTSEHRNIGLDFYDQNFSDGMFGVEGGNRAGCRGRVRKTRLATQADVIPDQNIRSVVWKDYVYCPVDTSDTTPCDVTQPSGSPAGWETVKLGEGFGIFERGRVIISSLQRNADGGQWIAWQRCRGAKVFNSSYGTQGTGATGTTFLGMGEPSNRITASNGTAVMFVEIAYDYESLTPFDVYDGRTIRYTAAFNVRDSRDLTQFYNDGPGASCNTYSAERPS